MMLEGCREGRHKDCKRKLEKTYFEGKKYVRTGEFYICKCDKRGCPCFVKATERKTQRRKK